ncbi:hypothetical protein [Defluviitalea phaphyphila]|uniref:hypothetical protein n=1 Tax=Defluviitalea phaphyphila TaxID=1473580 RepID=UPI001365AA48|nr:hypothetical protein [Defluviitalea phaphyphila]
MKIHTKIKFKIRQYGYGYKNIKSHSREIAKKIGEMDKYLDDVINHKKRRKK